MITDNSFQALIQLMEDPDELVFAEICKHVSTMGETALDFLEKSKEESYHDLLLQKRVDGLIQDLKFKNTENKFAAWLNTDDRDLLAGSIIIAQYQYPNLTFEYIYELLDNLKKAIWLELTPISTAFEKIKIVNKLFFEHFGYHTNTINLLTPLNSYINTVLELKTGNTLSLSILYSLLAQSLDIPVYIVNLPNQSVLAYMDDMHINAFLGKENPYGVLCYIDVSTKGSLVSEEAIVKFITDNHLAMDRIYFEPCSNSQIIKLMLENLTYSYQQFGMKRKVKELNYLKEMLS